MVVVVVVKFVLHLGQSSQARWNAELLLPLVAALRTQLAALVQAGVAAQMPTAYQSPQEAPDFKHGEQCGPGPSSPEERGICKTKINQL